MATVSYAKLWKMLEEQNMSRTDLYKKVHISTNAQAKLESDYSYDETAVDEYKNIRQVKWIEKGEWPHPGKAVMKTLTDISPYTSYVEELNELFSDDEEEYEEPAVINVTKYEKDDFLKDVRPLKTASVSISFPSINL